jgi:hypothetical protein
MNINKFDPNLICQILRSYAITKNVLPEHIKNISVYQSQIYGMQQVIKFEYLNHQYYISNDYSLMDNPKFVHDVLSEVNPDLEGKLLKSPITQSDGADYAIGVNGVEYYLWQSPL